MAVGGTHEALLAHRVAFSVQIILNHKGILKTNYIMYPVYSEVNERKQVHCIQVFREVKQRLSESEVLKRKDFPRKWG